VRDLAGTAKGQAASPPAFRPAYRLAS